MDDEIRYQWHPPFCGAGSLEEEEKMNDTIRIDELYLNRLPLRIDSVSIKKDRNCQFDNEIGNIYRMHNLMEFKSPNDTLNYNTFLKGLACIYLYKTREDQAGDIELSDMSFSFYRERKPVKLFKRLKEEGYQIEKKFPGVYYVDRGDPFALQIIVTGELDEDKHIWLTSLSNRLTKEHIIKLIKATNELEDEASKMYADAVWQLVASKNADVIKEIMEDEIMCEALERIMKPKMDEMYSAGFDNGFNNGFNNGFGDGEEHKGIVVFRNMINRGYAIAEAQMLAEISDEVKEKVLAEMG